MGKKVTHIITGLGKGGAETMLYQVIKFRTVQSLEYKVISLGGSSYYENILRKLGIPVEIYPIKRTPFSSMHHIIESVKGSDVLCCWMMHANLVGFIAAKFADVRHIIWCVRHSNTGGNFLKTRTVRIDSICARLSSKVNTITYNGNRSRNEYEKLGFCKEKGIVLDNGCDCEEYAPNSEARGILFKELGISSDKKIILSVTKNDPIKDIPTFIRAFAVFRKRYPETVAVMCGNKIEETEQLLSLCQEVRLKPQEDIFFLGLRHDVPILLAACDIYVLHSAGEAFPNTLLQAMSSSCLCIATDVGDARRIMGNDRFIITPQAPEAMAMKMEEIFAMPNEEQESVKARNRRRVQKYYDIRDIVKKYEELYT
ncbi:MAG: glycosyltransferase [Lachnospiraceae bacterium]|jgi:glycosyltransferase involved in cell wall biosynthesis|nr:glycosyltransferase [Lachnospiraceae bacterium]